MQAASKASLITAIASGSNSPGFTKDWIDTPLFLAPPGRTFTQQAQNPGPSPRQSVKTRSSLTAMRRLFGDSDECLVYICPRRAYRHSGVYRGVVGGCWSGGMRVCHHCSVLDCWSLGPMIAPRTSPPQGGTLSMAGRFPAPWRIVEILSGFAVEDACGQQLGVFYGSSRPKHCRTHRLPDFGRGATDGNRFRKAAGTAQAERE